jgi:iron(III) transport system substrate-binding protein
MVRNDSPECRARRGRGPVRPLTGAVAVLGAALLAAACSSSTGTTASGALTPAKLLNYHGSDRSQQLLKCANKEGAVQIYNANTAMDDLSTAFAKAYPKIKVNKVLSTSPAILTRIKAEISAGQVKGDVLSVSEASMLEAAALKYTQPVWTPGLATLRDKNNKSDTTTNGAVNWFDSYESYSGLAWNTNAVKNPPKTLQAFTDSQYKGQITMDSHIEGIIWVGGLIKQMGQDKANTYLKSLASNGMTTQNVSAATMVDLIGSGQVLMDPAAGMGDALKAKSEGKPVDWMPISVDSEPGAVASIAGSPHPCAGALFLDYVLSKKGQSVIVNDGFVSPVKGVKEASYISKFNIASLAKSAYDPSGTMTAEAYNTAYNAWSSLLMSTFTSK